MTKGKPAMKYLFRPGSVAVIGASRKKGKIGNTLIANMISGGYGGEIYPVNPEGGTILGRKVHKSVTEIEGNVDVALIAIPAKYVLEEIKNCAKKNVKHALIISSGFAEVGDAHTEEEIVAYAKGHGMRIIGPNIFGMYLGPESLNATFGTRDVRSGNIAIITQSGALGISLMGRTAIDRIGLSSMFSLGNKSDLDESDLLEYLAKDKNTSAVLMYVEGIKNGERIIPLLRRITKKKPVIAIKAGRSKRGAMAAASHTGSLAGSDNVFSGVIRQCGVIRAETLGCALDWCKFLSNTPLPKGENTVIITNGGGMGVMAADACEKYGVPLFDDPARLREIFSGSVPAFGSVKNPVDITGQATLEDYRKAIKAALKDPDIHSIICLGCETAMFDAKSLSEMIKEIYSTKKPTKPIAFSFFGGEKIDRCIEELRSVDIPVYPDVYRAVSCIGASYENYRNVRYGAGLVDEEIFRGIKIDDKSIGKIIDAAVKDGRQFLLPAEAEGVMNAADIRVPRNLIARNMKEAVKYAGELGYPVVMKVVSKDIIHKSDAGGVALDIDSKEEVIDAYQAIMHNCRKYKPDAHIAGVQISEMVSGDVEVIVGAIRDASFGPVVMFGLGGIYVEVIGDVSFRAFPLTKNELSDMLDQTKSSSLLRGVRGEKRKDINAVEDAITRLGMVLERHGEISDIEVNPLVVYEDGKGVLALDVRILLSNNNGNKGSGIKEK